MSLLPSYIPTRAPSNRELLVVGGLALAVGVGLYVFVKKAPSIAGGVGYSVGALAPNAAGGVVRGLGSGIGLPDTSDPQVVGTGRAALASGDWFTASLNLPAPEFLSAVWAKLTGGPAPSADRSAAPSSNTTSGQPGAPMMMPLPSPANLDPYQVF